MKYLKAQNILNEEMVEAIQQHIDGVYLYIPRKGENKKPWGENSGIKQELYDRNRRIYNEFMTGISINSIAESYYLTEHSIRRIIKEIKYDK
jgi:Mor family transcriptional regulator